MPIIEWTELPIAIRNHLLERAREREISFENLYWLKLWRESRPAALEGLWYKDFGSFKICGQDRYPKTFLLRSHVAKGMKIE